MEPTACSNSLDSRIVSRGSTRQVICTPHSGSSVDRQAGRLEEGWLRRVTLRGRLWNSRDIPVGPPTQVPCITEPTILRHTCGLLGADIMDRRNCSADIKIPN